MASNHHRNEDLVVEEDRAPSGGRHIYGAWA